MFWCILSDGKHNILQIFHFSSHYLLIYVDVVLCVSLELFIQILHCSQYYCTPWHPGRMQVVGGPWTRWLINRIRSCADKLGGGWEREVQRTARAYDNDGHGKDVGLRLQCCCLLLLVWRRERFPHKRTDIKRQRKEARGENTRSSRSCNDTELHCVLSIYCVWCRV